MTAAQQNMLEELQEDGPLDSLAMYVRFGRSWQKIWQALEKLGLVHYVPYAKAGCFYQVVKEKPSCKN